MSGIIIKMGIYGILRVTMSLPEQSLYTGIAVLLFSSLTGLYGVMQAIVQQDIKRLLAFCSIENIGIIGMGIGMGIMGLSLDYDPLSYLGFGGAILHTVNHSLVKSLLFFGAGVVVKATHTHNIEKMGGLFRRMPRTAVLFLVASLAICGLPPFNGFVSEFLIYSGLFRSLQDQSMLITVSSLLAIISLALIGGFAIFCFTKVFGIVFLGSPRSENAAMAGGRNVMMEIGQALPALLILAIGLMPAWLVRPVNICVQKSFSLGTSGIPSLQLMQNITTGSLIFIFAIALLTGLRFLLLRKRPVKTGPTWGCGYDALTVRHQYTATSYAQEYQKLYGPMLGFQPRRYIIPGAELFPGARSFISHTPEKLAKFFSWFFIRTVCMARKMAVLQTGHVRHYALYLLLYLVILLLLTFFNVL
jgi:formate hydrogenlyase subunit 3/multisubunit Na+/H+ antiporter MnhD subunit